MTDATRSLLLASDPFVATTYFRVWFRDPSGERSGGRWRLWSANHKTRSEAEAAARECLVGRSWATTRVSRQTQDEEWE